MNQLRPRLVVAALRGGAGKTTLSVALAVALQKRGIAVAPFKKGPDYIDAAWLSRAASRPCGNLDTLLMGSEQVVRSFSRQAAAADFSLIEGNRGLFDGVNAQGEFSTAQLAKLLNAPVVLIVDCDNVTATAAAMVLGCRNLDPAVDIRGVILSRVNGSRHAAVVRQAIEECCRLPVLGTVPRLTDLPFTQRHLGLIPPEEHGHIRQALEKAGRIAEEYLDITELLRIAASASSWTVDAFPGRNVSGRSAADAVRIGVVRDAAFQFYYRENLDALVDCGARLVPVSALSDKKLPDLDALYIGGGFPETHAAGLAANEAFRLSVRQAAERGLPIYAECGGFIYLGESLTVGGHCYPLAGALPLAFGLEKRPQGHGYTTLAVDQENPFFAVGTQITGHEFHYCRVLSSREDDGRTVCRVLRGTGMDGRRDGFCRKGILAGFTHLHALGTPQWAPSLVGQARQYRVLKQTPSYSHLSG